MANASSKGLILMTGASGFLGNHVVATFLAHGYRVRIANRNQSSCDRIVNTHGSFRGQIESVIVPDITSSGAFDEAVRDVDGVVHMASPFILRVKDNERDLILPALKGTQNMLECIQRHGHKVRRLVMTASFASIADFQKGLWPGHVYDETQWNPMGYEDTKNDRVGFAYSGSKKLAEEYAWSFMSSHPDLTFDLVTINPVNIFGPPVAGSADLRHLGQSLGSMYDIWKMSSSSSEADSTVSHTALPFFVDVRDVAQAHRLVFETFSTTGSKKPERFLLCGGKYSNQGVYNFWKKNNNKDRGDGDMKGEYSPEEMATGVGESYKVDVSRARKILGLEFRGFEECFGEMGSAFRGLSASSSSSSSS